jgi:uncharacterized protein involved in exopolysaccharide biosynthesis
MAQYELNLRDYWMVLRKRQGIILVTVGLVAGFTFLATQFLGPAPIYKASARVKFDRSTTTTGLLMEVLTFSEGSSMATQTEVARSVPVMLRVGKEFGLIDKTVGYNEVRRSPDMLAKVYALQSQVEVDREESTNILRIS